MCVLWADSGEGDVVIVFRRLVVYSPETSNRFSLLPLVLLLLGVLPASHSPCATVCGVNTTTLFFINTVEKEVPFVLKIWQL